MQYANRLEDHFRAMEEASTTNPSKSGAKPGDAGDLTEKRKAYFRQQIRKKMAYDDIGGVVGRTGMPRRTLEDWYANGVAYPNKASIEALARDLNVDDPEAFFFGPYARTAPKGNGGRAKAPKWMHMALDDAWAASKARELLRHVVTFAGDELQR